MQIRGTVKAKAGLEDKDRNTTVLARKAAIWKQGHLAGLADTHVVVHHSACTNLICMEESSEGNLTCNVITEMNVWCMQNII